MIILHASIAILGVLLLIIVLKVEPVIALVLGSLYLGIAGGIGLAETVEVIAVGFGEIMAEVGLLIGFGVLLGHCCSRWAPCRSSWRCCCGCSGRSGSRTR